MKLIKMTIAAASMAVAVCSCTQTDDAGKLVERQRIPEGTVVAFAVANPDGGPFQCLVDQVRAKKDLLMDAFFKQARISAADRTEMEKFQEQCGVSANDFKWFAMTVGEIKPNNEKVPEMNYAYAVRHDIDKILAAVRDQMKRSNVDAVSFAEFSLDGQRAWKVEGIKDLEDCSGMEPCFTSLKGRLFLVSTRKAGLKRLVDLYLGGKGEDSNWKDFGVSSSRPICLRTMPIGKIVRDAVEDPDDLEIVDNFVPNGAAMLRNLGPLSLMVRASGDAKNAVLDLSLVTGGDADADSLVTMSKTGLMTTKAMLTKQAKRDPDLKPALEAVNAMTLAQEGAVAKLKLPVSVSVLSQLIDQAIGEICK